MTEVYFIRHARPDYSVRDDAARPLTEEGKRTCVRVTDYLMDKSIGLVVASPFRRAVDTVAPFAQASGLEIQLDGRFQERKISGAWIEDYDTFSRRQWEDFTYREADGESLGQTQTRWLEALGELLRAHPGEHIAIGCHGAGLAALLRHYDPQFGLEQFLDLVDQFPWCAHLSFDGESCVGASYIDLSLR